MIVANGQIKFETKQQQDNLRKGISITRQRVTQFILDRQLLLDLASYLEKNPIQDEMPITLPENAFVFLESNKKKQISHRNMPLNVINIEKYFQNNDKRHIDES